MLVDCGIIGCVLSVLVSVQIILAVLSVSNLFRGCGETRFCKFTPVNFSAGGAFTVPWLRSVVYRTVEKRPCLFTLRSLKSRWFPNLLFHSCETDPRLLWDQCIY